MLCFLEGDHMYVVSSAYAVCDPASLSHYTLFITSPLPAPLVLQFLGTSFCSQPRAPVPCSSRHLRGCAAAYPGLTVYPVLLRITAGHPFQITLYFLLWIFKLKERFWNSQRKKEKQLGYVIVIFLLLVDLVTLPLFPLLTLPGGPCVSACDGSHTVWLPAEPPRPAAGPASRLHAVSPDSSRTLGPRLLPWSCLFVLFLIHLLALTLYYLQLPGRWQPVSRAAPPPPSPRPPALPAASPPASASSIVAYPSDAFT